MNELTIFKNEQFGEMRTVTIGEEIWFVGKDVAEILGYSNPQKAIRDHVDSEDKTLNESFTVNGTKGILINESGLYSLVLSSKLPSAKDFKRWVTSEVLPSIRKHGAYMSPETIERVITDPDFIIRLANELKTAQQKVAELQPKADYFDTVSRAEGSTSFRETAKVFGIGEREFIRYIESARLCYRNSCGKLIPYAEYSRDKKWFEVKEIAYGPASHPNTTLYTKITPLGRTKIFNKMRKAGIV